MSATVGRAPEVDQPYVCDGGLETDLIFHHGVDLPEFAAFPLLVTATGRQLLRDYYDGYIEVAATARAGLILDAPTWRSNPDWGARLGYDAAALDRTNAGAIEWLAQLRRTMAGAIEDVVISGVLGPRGDGYRSTAGGTDPDEAAAYHRPQLAAFAAAGADLATAYTLTDTGEALGIAHAANDIGLPVAISFTVETDGQLPSGESLADAITTVDAAAAPAYFMINCAHPSHIEAGLGAPGAWRDRVRGLRYNASRRSHAELDEAEQLDEGDPRELAAGHQELRTAFAHQTILGGCCGTDSRHVAALWGQPAGSGRRTSS